MISAEIQKFLISKRFPLEKNKRRNADSNLNGSEPETLVMIRYVKDRNDVMRNLTKCGVDDQEMPTFLPLLYL